VNKKVNSLVFRFITVGILALVILGGCAWYQIAYNRIVSQDETVSASWAQLENVLQRRYDLIPNLVSTVKGFSDHEKDVLTEVTRLRSQWQEAQTVTQKANAANGLEPALGRLLVVSEQYPNLKSNENFLQLQDELAGTENRISIERYRYNEALRAFNTSIRSFPNNVIAGFHHFERKDSYFQANVAAQTSPKVSFGK